MAGLFEALLPGAVTAGAGVAMAKGLTDLGAQASDEMNQLGNQVNQDMQFKPYSVRTGMANSTVAQDGSIDVGLGGGDWGRDGYDQGMAALNNAGAGLGDYQNASLGAAGTFREASLTDPAARQQQLFEQMQAAQQPALQRARSAMETRAFNQGRSGIMGNQYGGTSEQFAQSKAEAEARNNNMLQAQQLGLQEQMQQGQLSQMYGSQGLTAAQMNQGIGSTQAQLGLQGYQNSFLPLQNQLQAMQMGAQNANLAQTGQISGNNMLAQLGLGGIQAEVNAGKAASELYGNMFGALAQPLGSLGSTIDGAIQDGGGLWDSITSIFGN